MPRSQMGQRTFIIGNSRLGLRGFLCRLRATFGVCLRGSTVGSGFIGSRRFAGILFGLGGGLVGLTAVIGLIEAGTLEQHGRPGAEQAAQLRLAAFGTLPERLVLHRLKLFKLMLTGITSVFVRRHGSFPLLCKALTWFSRPARVPKQSRAPGAARGRES